MLPEAWQIEEQQHLRDVASLLPKTKTAQLGLVGWEAKGNAMLQKCQVPAAFCSEQVTRERSQGPCSGGFQLLEVLQSSPQQGQLSGRALLGKTFLSHLPPALLFSSYFILLVGLFPLAAACFGQKFSSQSGHRTPTKAHLRCHFSTQRAAVPCPAPAELPPRGSCVSLLTPK